MEYQGRSPLKDVARSVIMGAAMIPAAVLAGCSRGEPATGASGTSGSGGWQNAAGPAQDPNAIATQQPQATPDAGPLANPVVTRPRGTITDMPTRGFAGRPRRVRG